MFDLIINGLSTQGPSFPMWVPFIAGIPINSPLVGSFLAIVVSVIIALYTINRSAKLNRAYIETVEKTSEEHIEAVKTASSDQIKETRYWIDLKRKQLLKSLIEEIESNINTYKEISAEVEAAQAEAAQSSAAENKGFSHIYVDFDFVILEKCLTDTPIDDDQINRNLVKVYNLLKNSQNHIIVTRTYGMSNSTMKWANRSIVGSVTNFL